MGNKQTQPRSTKSNHRTPSLELDTEEQAAWLEVCDDLIDAGHTPQSVEKKLLRRTKHTAPDEGGGMLGAAQKTLGQQVTWGSILYGFGIVLGFVGLLKLIGMAFDIDIPILHRSTATLSAEVI
jgi:hypothetical protein